MKTLWFFDPAVRRSSSGASVIPGPLRKSGANPLFTDGHDADRAVPWESFIENGYPNVFFDPLVNKYRCYYTSYLYDDKEALLHQTYKQYVLENGKRITGILYAESVDGYEWHKPDLRIVCYQDSYDNNIIAVNTHGAGVLLDMEDPDPSRRYKMISRNDQGPLNIFVAFSADGLHFGEWITVIDSRSCPGDTHNFVIRDRASGQYVLYTRMYSHELRTVARFVSNDFIHWTDAREVFRGEDADDQVYGMPVFYQDGHYWGLAHMFHFGDQANPHYDHVDVELTCSTDGIHWLRPAPGVPFLSNGAPGTCDSGCCYASVPVSDGREYRFYYMGGDGTHYSFRKTGLCLGTVEKNRLVGVTAAQGDGFIYETRNMTFDPAEIRLCVDVEQDGSIVYEALDSSGKAMPECTVENCAPILTSCTCARIHWQASEQPLQNVRIRFFCKKATLYTMCGDIQVALPHPVDYQG